MLPIQVRKCPGNHVALAILLTREWLKQAAAHNLEPLLNTRRPPHVVDAPDHIAQAIERIAPT